MAVPKRLSRRKFLHLSATSTAASLLAACSAAPVDDPAAAVPDSPTAAPDTSSTIAVPTSAAAPTSATAPTTFTEAPMLAERVAQGLLPPVDQRLPAKPMVVQTLREVGQYGGVWRMGMEEDDGSMIAKSTLYEGLVRWNAEWTDVEPNLAESWQIENEGRKYTFKLHEGVKWSDGKLFTTADIAFWANEIRGNEDLHGDHPDWMQIVVDGQSEDAKVTLIDEYTISFEWSQPHGMFLQNLAIPSGIEMVHYQAEYAKQWHIDYNPDVVQIAEEQQLPSWVELWDEKVAFEFGGIYSRNQNPELPTLTPWLFTARLGDSQLFEGERNPYYWKVDSAGQQLPYIDRLAFSLVSDREVLLLSALNGEIDLQDRRIGGPANKAVLADSRERAGFDFFDTITDNMNELVISLNLSHKDPLKREIYNQKLFRQALSVAIDRQAINDLVYLSQSKPWQAAPRPESAFYDDEFATQFTEYNPDQANAWLDELGYTRGADGMRVGPDGNTITIIVESDTQRDAMDVVIENWEAVGIKAVFSQSERSLFRTRTKNNDHDATAWPGNSGLDMNVMQKPFFYMPSGRESHFGMGWFGWNQSPDDPLAVEPPEPIKQQFELHRQLGLTADPQKQRDLMRQILQIAKDEFLVIGTLLATNGYGIVKNNIGNVPDVMFSAHEWPQPGAARPEQFFFDQG
ncbi:MAG: ABC transporter substrate-binding protein [Chloroflexales bacterium]|nr:ABC transporter substrate-binding protein [Chloroflexales bacterium]